MKTIRQSFQLNTAVCDEIAEQITEFCKRIGTDQKDMLRYRLSAEECLLYWMDHGLLGNTVILQMGRYMRSPYVTLEIEGRSLNPYAGNKEDFGTYTNSILVSLDLSPEYSYSGDRNRIRFRIKKKAPNQIVILCMILGTAALIGILGMLLIPQTARETALNLVIKPLYNTFFKILGCIAGPMIFLSVAWGIYGIGDTATFGRIGRKMMLRYTLTTFIAAAACTVFFPILGPGLSSASGGSGQFGTITDLILSIIPSNIIEPFLSGNTLQLILLSIVIGIALLFLGKKTATIAMAIDQINILVQFLMQLISKLVPFVIFLMILGIIWSGSLSVFSTAWIFFACMFAMMLLMAAVFLFSTSVRRKVSPLLLIRKNTPAFLIALSTASSAAAFGSNVETCERKFGIDPSLVKFGIPLGMVMHKPIAAAYNLLIVFYFAAHYHINASIEWICVAVFISTILAIATPPIPGGGVIAYSVLFLQMGIPSDAMAIALALDIITDFFLTAFEMFLLPISLINTSSGMGMIDPKILQKDS